MKSKTSTRSYLWYGTALLAADIAGVWFLERRIVQLSHRSIFLALPLAFCLLHLLTIALFAVSMIYLKSRREIFNARAKELEPKLQELLADYAHGGDQHSALLSLASSDPRIVEHYLKESIVSLKGEARERLALLSATMGFLSEWKRDAIHSNRESRKSAVTALGLLPANLTRETLQKALLDREPEIRVLASRALVQTGDRKDIEAVFKFALDQDLRVRACLAEDLRPHAVQLSETATPEIIASSSPRRISTLLNMMGAWRRSVRLDGWPRLFKISTAANRAALLRIFPYITTPEEAEWAVMEGLRDSSVEVKRAAATVAAEWSLAPAIPILSSMLTDSTTENSFLAAQALTRFGPEGEQLLGTAVLTGPRQASGAALEALENFNTGRLAGTAL